MFKPVLPLVALMLLLGCARVPSSNPGPEDVCPTLFQYSQEQLFAAADELEALQEGSVLAIMVADYGVVRNQIRVCLGLA